jgi:hypothetical protein
MAALALALLAALAHAGPGDVAGVVSVLPTSVPTTGGVPLVIALNGSFSAAALRARPLKCKLSPACSRGHYDNYEHQCSSVVHATFQSRAGLLFDAKLLNATHATCTPPPVVVAGPVLLSLGAGCTVGGGDCSNYLKVSYHSLVDVAVGRRPYIDESSGALLLSTHASLRGVPLSVTATLAFANTTWSWQLTPNSSDGSVLHFSLGGLPATVNNDLCVDVAFATGKVSQCRRFMRAAMPPHGAAQPVQVDHHTKRFLINGAPFTVRRDVTRAAVNSVTLHIYSKSNPHRGTCNAPLLAGHRLVCGRASPHQRHPIQRRRPPPRGARGEHGKHTQQSPVH